jgi:hypothetical protein
MRGRKKRETENPRDKPRRLALDHEAAIAVVREERKCRKGSGTCGSGSKSRPYEAPRTFTVIRSDGSRAYFEAIAPS